MASEASKEGLGNGPQLWLRYLSDLGSSQARPGLYLRSGGWQELPLKERTRAFLAAVTIPRHLAERSSSAQVSGDLWRSGEIVERMVGYSNRTTIHHAVPDLREVLADAGLDADRYLTVRSGGLYGVRDLHVDVIELILARDSPEHVDELLAICEIEPLRFGLSPANKKLLSTRSADQLAEVLRAAAARVDRVRSPERAEAFEEAPVAVEDTEGAPPNDGTPETENAPPPTRRRWPAIMIAVVLGLAIVGVLVVVSAGGGASGAGRRGRIEVVGGSARTWSNPETAGGQNGAPLYRGMRISITCKVRGFQVADGDIWWYRLGSRPWSDHDYATADAFYNNGHTSGPLKGSALVDSRVPTCR